MKKRIRRSLLPAVLAAILICSALPVKAAQNTVLLGDADRNGVYEAADARFVLRCAVELEYYNAVDMLICDVDDNGYIQAEDARLAVGLDSLDGKTVTYDDSMDTRWEDPFEQPVTKDEYLSEAERIVNARLIYRKLSEFGWSKNAICAVLGNLEQESTLSPGLHQLYGSGYGLAQWTPGSYYTDWADENGYAADSLEGQLIFLNYTMRPDCEPERRFWYQTNAYPLDYESFIHSSEEVAYLTAAFTWNYERPGIPHMDRRIAYAERWLIFFTELGL